MTNHEMLKAGRARVEEIVNSNSAVEDALWEECYTYTDLAEVIAFLTDCMGSPKWDERISDLVVDMLTEYRAETK